MTASCGAKTPDPWQWLHRAGMGRYRYKANGRINPASTSAWE
jgi:hypothetical protein